MIKNIGKSLAFLCMTMMSVGDLQATGAEAGSPGSGADLMAQSCVRLRLSDDTVKFGAPLELVEQLVCEVKKQPHKLSFVAEQVAQSFEENDKQLELIYRSMLEDGRLVNPISPSFINTQLPQAHASVEFIARCNACDPNS